MTHRTWALLIVAAAAALLAAQTAAARARSSVASGVVFVQTDESSGNHVVVFDRAPDGTLARRATYATGGKGAVAAPGTETDHLASQGSLAYDPGHRVLIAVNAGSNTVSTFKVDGDRLELENVVGAGGDFPASIAVHGDLVYVLDAGGPGAVQGFRITAGGLAPLPDSRRALGLGNTNPPFFLDSPGQVGFTPDAGQLIVTTKASGGNIDVFEVALDGRLSASPVTNASATPVPFAFTFTPSGRLASGEAGASSLTTYSIGSNGTLADPKSLSDGQAALCWIQRVGRFYYVSNTASNTISAFTVSDSGQPALVGTTGVVARTPAGPIDLTSPSGASLLYAETGGGTLNAFRVDAGGTLALVQSVGGLPVGIEGVAST